MVPMLGKNHPNSIQVIEKVHELLKQKSPILVAIDGGSGSGKSTLARAIVDELNATLIPIDDFFSGDIPEDNWKDFSTEEKLENVFNWKQLKNDVLIPLLKSMPVKWRAFDFEQGLQSGGTYRFETEYTTREPSDVILLEGAYSFHPKLAKLVDLSVLVDVDIKIRNDRLIGREPKEFLGKWHEIWDDVEEYYYKEIRPKISYDLVVL